LVGFDAQAAYDGRDLDFDGFMWDQVGHAARDVVLHGDAEYAADDDDQKHPHEKRGESAAPTEAGGFQDKKEAQQSEPDMGGEPGFHAPEGRSRIFLAESEEEFEDDNAGAHGGEEESE